MTQMHSKFVTVASALFAVAVAAQPALAQAKQEGKAALNDPTIVAIFDAANTFDMETGALAAKKGTTKDVRDFGAMLADVHMKVRQQGRDLAKKLGVTPTPPSDFALTKQHEETMKKLNAASGKEFDRAFLQNEVDYHKAVIDAVTTTLLPAIQNAEVKDMVVKVAPAFESHRAEAQNLLDKSAK